MEFKKPPTITTEEKIKRLMRDFAGTLAKTHLNIPNNTEVFFHVQSCVNYDRVRTIRFLDGLRNNHRNDIILEEVLEHPFTDKLNDYVNFGCMWICVKDPKEPTKEMVDKITEALLTEAFECQSSELFGITIRVNPNMVALTKHYHPREEPPKDSFTRMKI